MTRMLLTMENKIVEKELSFQIMNAAYEVHNQLGPGFLEAIYEAAMTAELRSRGFTVETQVSIPVFYKGTRLGEHILDMVIEHKIILELKAVIEILPIHKQQAISYLKASGLPLAIVINFGAKRVESERLVNTKTYH
jgi:GxxExxY protein